MANISLRSYQTQAIEELRQSFVDGHEATVLVLPTGAGKTTVAAELTRLMVARGKRVWFVAHLLELVEQARARMELFGLKPGTIAPDWGYHKDRLVQCAMVQTLSRRIGQFSAAELPDFIFFDEGHHTPAGTYVKVIEAAPLAKRIGLTATPFRLDGRGLGDFYSHLVAPISAAQLVEQGHLVPARYFGTEADLDGLKTVAGDYAKDELYKRFNKRELYSGTVNNYQNFASGRKAIVFCVNVEHSQLTVAAFNERGISAAHLDGSTPASTRKRILQEFAAGKYTVLSNVALFTEGFDLPDIGAVILNRATQSTSLYLQMIGRGLRPSVGKSDCIVIDHGGNVKAHGFFDDEREYSLEAAPKKKRKKSEALDVAPIKECPSCRLLVKAQARTCEDCGHEWPQSFEKAKEADFLEITRDMVRVGGLLVAKSTKPSKAKPWPEHLQGRPLWSLSESELREIARFCGHNPGWVKHQLDLRKPKALAA